VWNRLIKTEPETGGRLNVFLPPRRPAGGYVCGSTKGYEDCELRVKFTYG